MDYEEFYDRIAPREAAYIIGVRPNTLRLWAQQGLITQFILSHTTHRRYSRKELEGLAKYASGRITAEVARAYKEKDA